MLRFNHVISCYIMIYCVLLYSEDLAGAASVNAATGGTQMQSDAGVRIQSPGQGSKAS